MLDDIAFIRSLPVKHREELRIGDVTVHHCSSHLVVDVITHPNDKFRRDGSFLVIEKEVLDRDRKELRSTLRDEEPGEMIDKQ